MYGVERLVDNYNSFFFRAAPLSPLARRLPYLGLLRSFRQILMLLFLALVTHFVLAAFVVIGFRALLRFLPDSWLVEEEIFTDDT